MQNQDVQKSLTLEDLGKFTEEVILPGVENIVERKVKPLDNRMDSLDNRMDSLESGINTVRGEAKQYRDEILTVEDKVAGDLSKFLQEQAAIGYNYKRLEKRVHKLESIISILLKKMNLSLSELSSIK